MAADGGKEVEVAAAVEGTHREEDERNRREKDLIGSEKLIFESLTGSCKNPNSYCLENLGPPFVSVHLQSFLGIGYSGSSRNRYTVALRL